MVKNFETFIFPILAGYIFLTCFRHTNYRIKRESGYHVLFKSYITGYILFLVSFLLIKSVKPFATSFLQSIGNIVPIDNAEITILMFLLACFSPFLLNKFYDAENDFSKYLTKKGTEMERLIYQSFLERIPLQISLRSRKVYIGFVSSVDFSRRRVGDVRILPTYSGYRDESTQKLKITTNYWPLHDSKIYESVPNINYMSVVFPMSEIVLVRNFDENIHQIFEKTAAES